MKLFTKEIDKKLFAQYSKGSDLSNQMVVAKIFNPYGRGTWYLINSDEDDPDYLWAIVDLFEVEVGSVSRKELESIKIKPFNFGLERDLSFRPRNAEEVFKGLLSGKTYAKGGKLKYDPSRDIVAIAIKDGPFTMMFTKGDFLGGAYQMEKGGSLENYNYVSPRNIIFARLKSGEDIKPISGFYIRKDASGTVITGDESKPLKKANVKSLKISIPRPILLTGSPSKSPQMMKFIGTFSSKDLLRPAMTFVQVKEGSIIATDANKLIRIIDGSTLNEDKLVCESRVCKDNNPKDQKFPATSQVINSIDSQFSESYDMVDLYESLMQVRNDDLKNKVSKTLRVIELKLENATLYFNITLLLQCVKACLLLGWKKAFISYHTEEYKAIVFTEENGQGRLSSVSLILLMPIFAKDDVEKVTITPKVLLEQGGVMADGGEVFIPTTYLDYNPDYLVGTNTMYEMFADGGVLASSFEEGDDYWTIEEGKVVYSVWDDVSEEIAEKFPSKMYFTSEKSAQQALNDGYADGGIVRTIRPINAVYYNSSDYNYPYTLIIGNLTWGISDEFEEPTFRGDIQKEFFMSTYDFAAKSGYLVANYELPESVLEKVKKIRSKLYDTLRGKRYVINSNDLPEFFENGGKIGFEALSKKVAARYEGKSVKPKFQAEYGKTYSSEEASEVGDKVAAKVYRQQQAKMAEGGKLSNGKDNFEKGDEGMYEGNLVRVLDLNTSFGKYYFDVLDENDNVITQDAASKEKFERNLRHFPKMAEGRALEGKKRFYETYNVGRSKYVVSFHDGLKKHNDGSDFFGARIFKNKKDLEAFKKELLSNGYLEQSMAKGGEVKSPYIVTFGFQEDGEYAIKKSKPIFAENENAAAIMLKDQFEAYEGLSCDIINVKKMADGGMMSKGGALEHMIFKGDKIRAIHRNMVIVESDLGSITVLDFRTEPIARRISVEPITGKNTLASAIDFIDADPSFKTTTMAMGGSLQGHGFEVGDRIAEDLGGYIRVVSEDGKDYFIKLRDGDRLTEPPLPFEHGGEVKIGDLARLAKKYNKRKGYLWTIYIHLLMICQEILV
jgi:hypothetical protein